MKRWYLIVLTLVVLALILAAPVSAYYSLSVSGGNTNAKSHFSPKVASLLNQYKSPMTLFGSDSSDLAAKALVYAAQPSKGSATAYSKGVYQDQYSMVEFDNRVSVDGLIYNFNYEARFDSSVFR